MTWFRKLIMKAEIRQAISEYEKIMILDPQNLRVRLKLANLRLENRNLGQAVEEYIWIATQYEEEELYRRAISIYKKVLAIRPEMVEFYHRLANLYKREGFLADAKSVYQKITRLAPGDQRACEAIQEIEKAVCADWEDQGEKEAVCRKPYAVNTTRVSITA